MLRYQAKPELRILVIGLTALLGLLGTSPLRGQESVNLSAMEVKDDPLISIQALGGYFFWNVKEVYDTMPAIVQDHQKALNQGLRYGGDILFHFSDGFSLGVTYRQLGTAHTTEPNYWVVPVTDSNNRVVIDPNTGGLLYGSRLGEIQEDIRLWFFGVRLIKEFELNSNFNLGFGIAPGVMNYFESGDFVGYKTETEGSNLAMDISASGRYKMDRNWSVLFQFSLFNGIVSQPYYTDLQQGLNRYPLSEPLSVVHLSLNLGLRFTINHSKKDSGKNKHHPEMPEPMEKERFQLVE